MISIIHPSARPEKAWDAMYNWVALSAGANAWIEYVICLDIDCEWKPPHLDPVRVTGPLKPGKWFHLRLVYNTGRRCSVDATNVGAQGAHPASQILTVTSDDISPCQDWDTKVMAEFKGANSPRVIAVDTMDQEDPTHTLTVQILNRARYEQLGYIFHPDYTSMYADDEFTRHAKKDGVLHEALHIKMKHERFERDEVYERQQGAARFAWGEALLRHREKHGFPRVTPGLASMREVVNIWNLGEGRITGEVEKAIAALEGR